MNDTQLSYFLAVYDHGGYSAAANAMFTSRQVLGRSVTELEREVGGKLFERKGRGIEPTLLGAKCAKIARSILADMDRLKCLACAQAEQIEGKQVFVVAVSVHGPRGISLAPQALQLFMQTEFPNIGIIIEELSCESCPGALEAGLIDAAITLGEIEGPLFANEIIGSRDAFLAVSESHPLADAGPLSIADLKGVSIAQPESLSYMLPHVNKLCAAHGFAPSWCYGGKDDAAMLRFVEGGGAILLCKNSPLVMGASDIKLVSFKKSAKMLLPFCCAYRKDLDIEDADAILAKLKEFFR